ncbi:hypothetical protein HN587_07640 [Candidatus Woesearchaeota archaeon]|jgi:hypothetical protein|nr:hypothetical protein [Candidatus Woesearchaeota archaeon]
MVKLSDYGFSAVDKEEVVRGKSQVFKPLLGYPKPVRRFKLIQEMFSQSVEEIYYWLLNSLRDDFGLYDAIKIKDIFTASEQSAFWGQSQSRLSIQQGQVSNYLQTIGKLLKDLFMIVREIRILKERLVLYEESNKLVNDKDFKQSPINVAAEIALRGYWVDLKDGGAKSPASVYGMAANLGFSTLPDLFFAAPPLKATQVDKYVNGLDFNRKVKEVLKRKLKQFLIWKEATYHELKTRETFVLKYLRQHYNSIQLYLDWIKPYLRNVKKLSMSQQKSESEDLIGAFEGSITDIEILLRKPGKNPDYKSENAKYDVNSIVLVSIYFRTRPSMDFHAEGYQHKGPVHVGRTEITLRSYAWTNDQLHKFMQFKEAEDLEIIGSIDQGIKDALDALGDELKKYLRESHGEKLPEDLKAEELKKITEKETQLPGMADPFKSLLSGFGEIFTSLIPGLEKYADKDARKKKKAIPSDYELKGKLKGAEGPGNVAIWNTYKNFKKAHKMVTW